MATKLWSEIDGEPWLDNPRRKRRRAKGRKRSHRRRNATAVLANPRRKRGRRRRPSGFMLNRHHRRRHHRNPPSFGLRGIGARVIDGLKGGLAVLAGEAAASAIPKLIPVAAIQTGIMSAVAEVAVGIFTAPFVAKLVGQKWAQVYLYGAFSRPLKGFVVSANLPIVSPALAAYPGSMLQALPIPSLSAYGSTADDETLAIM
jgi:hypothetical protein